MWTSSFVQEKFSGLVGDNGAGKSTFMKILSGAYQADSGRVFFEGKHVEIRNPHHSREIGIEMVYQDLALCRRLDIGLQPVPGPGAISIFRHEISQQEKDAKRGY